VQYQVVRVTADWTLNRALVTHQRVLHNDAVSFDYIRSVIRVAVAATSPQCLNEPSINAVCTALAVWLLVHELAYQVAWLQRPSVFSCNVHAPASNAAARFIPEIKPDITD
jgi:hypothetical protein